MPSPDEPLLAGNTLRSLMQSFDDGTLKTFFTDPKDVSNETMQDEIKKLREHQEKFAVSVLGKHWDRIQVKVREYRTSAPKEKSQRKQELLDHLSALRALFYKEHASNTLSLTCTWCTWWSQCLPFEASTGGSQCLPFKVSWPNMRYVLQTYALMMAAVMLVAFFVGEMMRIFLFVMTKVHVQSSLLSVEEKLLLAFWVLALPVLILMGSMLIFISIYLLQGQAHSVSFARCRGLFLTALLLFRKNNFNSHTDEDFQTACGRADWWFQRGFTCCMVVAGLGGLARAGYICWRQTGDPNGFYDVLYKLATYTWGGTMLGALLWAIATITVHILCDLYVRSKGDKEIGKVTAAQTAIIKYNIRPGKMARCSGVIRDWMRQFAGEETPTAAGVAWGSPRWTLSGIGLMALIGLVLLTCMADGEGYNLFGSRFPQITLFIMMVYIALAARLLAVLVSWKFPELLKLPFWMAMTVGLVSTSIVFFSALHEQPLFDGRPTAVPLANHGAGAWVWENLDFGEVLRSGNGTRPPYPACLMRWGAHPELRIIDLGILCSYSYDINGTSYEEGGDVWNATSATFTGRGLTARILHHQSYARVGRVVVFRFTSDEGSASGTTVLVVKGSSDAVDFYADAGLWSMIGCIQMLTCFVSLLNQLPNQIFAEILWTLSTLDIFTNIDAIYDKYSKQYPEDAFLITGHSFGGGIATAAGGRLGIHAISFSGPGSHFSRWRFNTTMERAYRSALDIQPENDFVYKLDRHDETGQYIDCRLPNGHRRDFATCHQIRTTICELWRSCGDHRGRDFRQMCQELLNQTYPHVLGTYLPSRL